MMSRFIFLFLMLIYSVSWAEWEYTSTSQEGKISHYHDRATIKKNGRIVKMWSMQNYSSPFLDNGKIIKSRLGLELYDCISDTSALYSVVEYSGEMGKGEVVWSGTRKENELQWTPVIPNSVTEASWKIACSAR